MSLYVMFCLYYVQTITDLNKHISVNSQILHYLIKVSTFLCKRNIYEFCSCLKISCTFTNNCIFQKAVKGSDNRYTICLLFFYCVLSDFTVLSLNISRTSACITIVLMSNTK